MRAFLVGTLLATALSSAQAQVGHPPNRSPYRDRDYNRDWTLFFGQFSAQRDPAGVAPTDGPLAGVRWQMHMTGPLYIAARLAGGSVERTEIDPSKTIAERVIGTEKVPMFLADIALELSLTGHKTWHGIAPVLNGGVGFSGDLRGRTDVGDYRFGVPFTMTFGSGINWSINDAWALRFDWANYIYRIGYPNSYYLKTTEDPPVLAAGASQSHWRRNRALSIGVSLLFPRR
ncbi:MAG TPA: hypothetical protein VF981_10880 [Gemmatimonadaceae bacterium]